jgi:SMI1/KNR4 family protein SUKH-1
MTSAGGRRPLQIGCAFPEKWSPRGTGLHLGARICWVASASDLASSMESEFGPAWRLGSPAEESAVAAFESSNRIVLPGPYRDFIVNVANGAVGPPDYGLLALGEATGPHGHEVTPGFLERRFPLTAAWLWDGNEDLEDEEILARIDEVHQAGTLPLGTDGDGMDHVLVVSGQASGEVWMLADEFALPVARDFGAWILGDYFPDARWLLENRTGGAEKN